MSDQGIVSVLIPCYNGERTLGRCLDSLLKQTYRRLEIVLVNDGSTDGTEAIALQYQKRFEEAGMKFKYIYQENKGLGGAIDTALKAFTGDYLSWGDSDDFWFPESMEKRVEFLETHPEFACVSSDAYEFREPDLETPIGLSSASAKDIDNPKQFMNHLVGQPLFCAGTHMIRTEAFLSANPKRSIYPARHGQNNQLLLPVYYKYLHAFLPEPLYGCIIVDESMSRKKISSQEQGKREEEYADILKYTVQQISMLEREKKKYLRIVEGRRHRNRLYASMVNHNLFSVFSNIVTLICLGQWTKQDNEWLRQLIKKHSGSKK